MFKQVDPKLRIKNRDLELIFSSGATLKFAYLDNPSDKYNFQGAELTFIGFDEIQQLTEDNVIYLLSRLRSTSVDYKKQVVATGNPDYDSFMRHWVEFALDERGIPIRKEVYPTRYMVQVAGGKIEWSDSRQELEQVYGKGDSSGILSFVYVPGTIYDNPVLLKSDPTYLSKLKSLPRVEMERLLLGSWYARSEASGLFKREWTPIVEEPAVKAKKVRAWDFAFSKPSEQYPNPDWTRGTLISKDKANIYTIEHSVGLRDRVHEVEKLLFKTAIEDGTEVIISCPIDPNAQAGAYARDLQRRLGEMGFTCRLQKPVKSKITRFAPFSSVAQAGYVRVVRGAWNKEFFDELEVFGNETPHKDDIADTVSDAFTLLNKDGALPDFTLNNVETGGSPIFTGYNSSSLQGMQTFQSMPTFSF